MPGSLDFSFLFGDQPPPADRRDADPFRILVVGDFGGRGGGAATVHRVDLDRYDELLARMQPRVALAFGEQQLELGFASLDDFHPDSLLQRVEALQQLLQTRRQLSDPRQAAALLPPAAKSTAPATAAAPAAEPTGSMFERLLGAKGAADPVAAGLEPLLQRLVRPHLAPVQDPRVPELQAALDAGVTGLLREVLHHPSFQRCEAAWRGVHWLLQQVDSDGELQVALLDLGKDALATLAAAEPLDASPLHAALVPAGEPGFALVVVLHEYGASAGDLRALAALAALGARAHFAVVATAAPSLLGSSDLAAHPAQWQLDAEAAARWRALRQSPQAKALGLLLPRFLLRLPYGAATDRIDALPFEEQPQPPERWRYLWGAPGLVAAALLGAAFRTDGWQLQPERELSGLPMHTWRQDGALGVQPCTELLLGERAVAAARAAGLMPLQGFANRDAVRLDLLQAVAATPTALAGPWA